MNRISRRIFFKSTFAYGALLLPVPALTVKPSAPAREGKVLTLTEWRTLDAITERIIPTDETPGAQDAEVVRFIDLALHDDDRSFRELYSLGLKAIDHLSQAVYGRVFHELVKEKQDGILEMLDDGQAERWPTEDPSRGREFFEAVRVHTIQGFFSDPIYGGNKNYQGFKVVGFPGPAHHQGYSPEDLMARPLKNKKE